MKGASILVVEDERIVARDIQTTLQRAGYRVTDTVVSGAAAVSSAAAHPPDLVLMDVVLAGDIDGIEAARQIRRMREVPVVYLTANGDRAVLEQAKSTEPIGFILKPYEEQELLTSIEMALHQYQAQQQRSRQALAESEARYGELFETAREGMALSDLSGRYQACNRAYLQLLGYGALQELPACPWLEGVPLQEPGAGPEGESDEFETQLERADGQRLELSLRRWLRRNPQGQAVGWWLLARDITERKRAQQQIELYQERLRALMQELSVAEERERQRIATDIHDRISQTLAVCQMRVEALAQGAGAGPLGRELEQVGQLLERTLQDTSSLTFELCPPVLHQLGLGAALEWYGERLSQEHGLRVELEAVAGLAELSAEQRSALFRAACELMTNVVKHARARCLQVRLSLVEGILELLVQDDGIGLGSAGQSPARRQHGGFGLFHLRERLRGWGGSLTLEAGPEGGTRAQLRLPLQGPPTKVEQIYEDQDISGR